jgi:hypothetical protein
MAEGDFLQQSAFPDRSAVTTDIRSDDSRFSVSETQRLQQAAQQRIDAGRHDHIGAP